MCAIRGGFYGETYDTSAFKKFFERCSIDFRRPLRLCRHLRRQYKVRRHNFSSICKLASIVLSVQFRSLVSSLPNLRNQADLVGESV